MSYKFVEVLKNNKTAEILKNVLNSFNPKWYGIVSGMILREPNVTDDFIFQELAKTVDKKDTSFNSFKLTGVANLIKHIIDLNKNVKVLDFGGANGIAAEQLAINYKLKEMVVADVAEHKTDSKIVKFVKIEEGKKLPFKDGEFDVVFCMMTLHHIRDTQFIIEELHRVCRKWLIIQEHDATEGYPDILDIVHGIYIFVQNDSDYDKVDRFADFQAWYKPMIDWDKAFKNKFAMRWMKRTKSAQNNYFALYEKIDY